MAGDSPEVIVAKVTAVLVSAAVRASVIARGPDVSPSAINRATLSWYEMSHLRRRELLMSCAAPERPAPVRLGSRATATDPSRGIIRPSARSSVDQSD